MPDTDPNRWWRAGVLIALPAVRSLLRIRCEGFERIPSRGSAILAFDHVSVLDGPLLAIEVMRATRRTSRFLVAAEVFDLPVAGAILRRYDQIPLRRGLGDDRALDIAVNAARDGSLLAIAPEGTVNPRPEEGLQRIRSGAARMALAAGAPLLPVGIWGTQHRWPHRGLHVGRPLRPGVGLSIGPPILPVGGTDGFDAVADLTSRVRGALDHQVARAKALAAATG